MGIQVNIFKVPKVNFQITGVWHNYFTPVMPDLMTYMARIVPNNPIAFPPSMEVRCTNAAEARDGREQCHGIQKNCYKI